MTLDITMSDYMKKQLPAAVARKLEVSNNQLTLEAGIKAITAEALIAKLGLSEEDISVITFNNSRLFLDDSIHQSGAIRIFPSIIGG